MNMFGNRISCSLFLLLVSTPYSVSAIDLFGSKDVIWEESANEFVKLAAQDTSSFGRNDHPVDLKAEEISSVLRALRLKKEEASLFTDQQATLLGQHLAVGLRRAKPDQDIVFALQKSVSRAFALSLADYFVAGRAFYAEGKLNVIIGDYDRARDSAYEAVVDPTHQGIVRYNFDHGRRATKSRAFTGTIAEANGVGTKARRDDWLLIDVDVASEAVVHKRIARETEERARKREELKEILGSEDTSEPRKQSQSIEDRLTTLKRLREKALITEEEYVQKRKQILSEL